MAGKAGAKPGTGEGVDAQSDAFWRESSALVEKGAAELKSALRSKNLAVKRRAQQINRLLKALSRIVREAQKAGKMRLQPAPSGTKMRDFPDWAWLGHYRILRHIGSQGIPGRTTWISAGGKELPFWGYWTSLASDAKLKIVRSAWERGPGRGREKPQRRPPKTRVKRRRPPKPAPGKVKSPPTTRPAERRRVVRRK